MDSFNRANGRRNDELRIYIRLGPTNGTIHIIEITTMEAIFRSIVFFIAFSSLTFTLVGCASESEESGSSLPPTAQASRALAAVEPTSSAADETANTVTAVPPTPLSQEDTANSVLATITPDGTRTEGKNLPGTYIFTGDDDYYMVVSYALEEEAEDLTEGQKRILVTASLGNESGRPIKIGDDKLMLLDDAGNRYPVNIKATAEMNPALVGTELGQNENVYGFVMFDVPAHATLAYLEWCLSDTSSCERPLHAAIP